jgi:hypothetical protein
MMIIVGGLEHEIVQQSRGNKKNISTRLLALTFSEHRAHNIKYHREREKKKEEVGINDNNISSLL